MQKILSIFLLAAALSCSKLTGDAAWESIRVDCPELEFPVEGGSRTVTMENHSSWWISGGYEEASWSVEKGWKYVNYVQASSFAASAPDRFDYLDGGWYTALVPEGGTSRSLIVMVEANTSGQARYASILMEAGDAFTSIKVSQE